MDFAILRETFQSLGARRLIIAVVLFSSIITLVLTSIQLFFDYRNDLVKIEGGFGQIPKSHLPHLVYNVWVINEEQIQVELDRLLNLPDIEYLEINTGGQPRWFAGSARSAYVLERIFPMAHPYNDKELVIGELKVVVSLDAVFGRLVDKALVILLGNALKTFLVASFILIFFQAMIGRHIKAMADYTENLKFDIKGKSLTLDRKPSSATRNDELAVLTRSINSMRDKLIQSHTNLKSLVDDRTKELLLEITEHKETERRLRKAKVAADSASRAKSQFLASMSHELRTPMNAILGFAQLLEYLPNQPLTPQQGIYTGHIIDAGNHLLQLINDVLDMSQIESGKITLSTEYIQTAPLIRDCLALMGPVAESKNVRLIDNTTDTLPFVLADRSRLKQVLINLLSNAVKYNRPDGVVTLDAISTDDDTLRLSVIDTGNGIAEHLIDDLFDPFNRLGAEAGDIEGTGIGLVIAKKLTEMMGGRIGVQSALGQGSTFWIELPASATKVQGEAISTASLLVETLKEIDIPDGEHTIVYVEDNPANIALMETLLRPIAGITLFTAATVETGMELVRIHHPGVIILDINLPGLNGYDLLAHLKLIDQTRDIPVLALTAKSGGSDIKRGLDAGFRAYLSKPIKIQETLQAISEALRN